MLKKLNLACNVLGTTMNDGFYHVVRRDSDLSNYDFSEGDCALLEMSKKHAYVLIRHRGRTIKPDFPIHHDEIITFAKNQHNMILAIQILLREFDEQRSVSDCVSDKR